MNAKNKELYAKILEENSLPVFFQIWWLDSVCGSINWDVIIYDEKNLLAVWPYFLKKTFFGVKVILPPLTQKLGPWIIQPPDIKYYKQLSNEKKIITNMLKELPSYAMFSQQFDCRLTNWQPFYWRGFAQTTRYTYRLENILDVNTVWLNIDQKTRNQIRNAEKKCIVKIEKNNTNVLWKLVEKTFLKQNMRVPYPYLVFKLLQEKSFLYDKGVNIIAYKDEHPIAGAFFVYDDTTMYYLLSGMDEVYKDSQALSLILWEAIKLAVEKKVIFDFEGTMMENIEPHFRSYGAKQVPYFKITKYNSFLYKCAKSFKDVFLS